MTGFDWYYMHRRKPKSCGSSLRAVAKASRRRNNRVRFTQLNGVKISTVMLPFPHGLDGTMFFETAVFGLGGSGDVIEMYRAQTHREALRIHREIKNKYRRKA